MCGVGARKPDNKDKQGKEQDMKFDKKLIEETMRIVKADIPLMGSLRKWHCGKLNIPKAKENGFDEWLGGLIGDLSCKVGRNKAPAQVAMAVKVNACGTVTARIASMDLERHGYETDINCYVEDGKVYESVWVKGENEEDAKTAAANAARMFLESGRKVELLADEDGGPECTVCCEMPFARYVG